MHYGTQLPTINLFCFHPRHITWQLFNKPLFDNLGIVCVSFSEQNVGTSGGDSRKEFCLTYFSEWWLGLAEVDEVGSSCDSSY